MERIDLNELEKTLAIHAPWKINSVDTDENNKIINVHISEASEKRIFGFLKSNKSANDKNKSAVKWVYMPIGHYKCVIHTSIEESIEQEAFNTALFSKPAFIGHSKRPYSNYIRQQVCLAQVKGLDISMTASLLNIDKQLVSSVISDLTNSSDVLQSLAYLPCEADQHWQDVLSDKVSLTTKVLPLKFLLSKLKLNNHQHDQATLLSHANELRKFFIANANLLQIEMAKLVGLDSLQAKQKSQANKNKLRLVLPSTSDPVWLKILGGELKLNSNNLALNLLISRLRNNVNEDVLENINQCCAQLREYFKKNYRSLKAELILISKP